MRLFIDLSKADQEDMFQRHGHLFPPGGGWQAIAGSKHGGFHRRQGAGFEYWYPSHGITAKPLDVTEKEPVKKKEQKDKRTKVEQAVELVTKLGFPVEPSGPRSVAIGGKASFNRDLGKWNGQRGSDARRIVDAGKALEWLQKQEPQKSDADKRAERLARIAQSQKNLDSIDGFKIGYRVNTMVGAVVVRVPYERKEEYKSHGARWVANDKEWVVYPDRWDEFKKWALPVAEAIELRNKKTKEAQSAERAKVKETEQREHVETNRSRYEEVISTAGAPTPPSGHAGALVESLNISLPDPPGTTHELREGRPNQKGQACAHCGKHVKERMGVLTSEYDPFGFENINRHGEENSEDFVWKVRCRDKTACNFRRELYTKREIEKQKLRDNVARTRRELIDAISRPENYHDVAHVNNGDRIDLDDRRTEIYGGGHWMVIEPENSPNRKIWYVLNNGADGDDWSRNNIGTGGAGAIGWSVPYSAEVEDRIRSVSHGAFLEAIDHLDKLFTETYKGLYKSVRLVIDLGKR